MSESRFSDEEVRGALAALMDEAVVYGPGMLARGDAEEIVNAAARLTIVSGGSLSGNAVRLLRALRAGLAGTRKPRGILG